MSVIMYMHKVLLGVVKLLLSLWTAPSWCSGFPCNSPNPIMLKPCDAAIKLVFINSLYHINLLLPHVNAQKSIAWLREKLI